MFVDHYRVLGLPTGEEGAKLTRKQIDTAYRRMALLYHPDKRLNVNSEVAHQDFYRLKSSYDLLNDDKARKLFDISLKKRQPPPQPRPEHCCHETKQHDSTTMKKQQPPPPPPQPRPKHCCHPAKQHNSTTMKKQAAALKKKEHLAKAKQGVEAQLAAMLAMRHDVPAKFKKFFDLAQDFDKLWQQYFTT